MESGWLDRLKGINLRRGVRREGGAPASFSPAPDGGLPLSERYEVFTRLLKSNNRALEVMAELQAKIRGDAELSHDYVKDRVEVLGQEVGRIVEALERMSPTSARGLRDIHEELVQRIRHTLSPRRAIPEAPLVLPFTQVSAEMEEVVGGKAAHLGEMTTHLKLPVPPGFAVTTYAFKRFLDHNGLWAPIHEIMARSRLDEPDQVALACRSVEELIGRGELPADLALALEAAHAALLEGRPASWGVAVRSSAILEDTAAGFAGQYQTSLNVGRGGLAKEYRRILASQFSPQVVSFRHQRGLILEDVAMAVAVMLMVPARASGVLYTCNPNDPEQKAMMVSAVWGLGARAVGGQMPSSLILMEKSPAARVLRQEIVPQPTMTVCRKGGGVAEIPVPAGLADRLPLSPSQLRELAELGLRLEEYYGRPVDVEWAVDSEGELFLLQARGLRIIVKGIQPDDYDRLVAGHPVLLAGGSTASPGVATGRVAQVHTSSDLGKIEPGCVLVAQSSLPEYAMALDRVSALITEVGGPASHLASVARERRVPAVFSAVGARDKLREGALVTVDADHGRIFEGEICALVILQKKRFLALAETQAYRNLERVLSRITPLNLTDPRLPEFTPGNCRSLHDITRYCHEMAMQEMFRYSEACTMGGGDTCLSEGAARRLVADFPLDLYLVDLGGGIAPGARGLEVREEDVTSLPLLGLLKGIHSVEWRGPGAVSAQTLAQSLAERGEEGQEARVFRHNYVLISRDYMNLSSRLGFHYSTIDAYCSKNDSDNYLRLAFMRGGADPARRARRARYVGTVLEKSGFWVEVGGDNVYARLEKYPAPFLQAKLGTIGRLIVMTRQMDMVMFSDAVVDWYIDQFMKGEAGAS